MKYLIVTLLIALLGVTTARAVSTNWSSADAAWSADGTFHTGFGATTTASFSIGMVFTVTDLASFTSSTVLLGTRNNNSVANDTARNTGPSFELWGDGKVRGKAINTNDIIAGAGFTVNSSYQSGNNKESVYMGVADLNTLLKTGENAIALTVNLFANDAYARNATYTLYINGQQVVETTHLNIGEPVYNYQNLAAVSGSTVYYMNGIATQADINSLPEPTVLALLALGVAGVALRRKAA